MALSSRDRGWPLSRPRETGGPSEHDAWRYCPSAATENPALAIVAHLSFAREQFSKLGRNRLLPFAGLRIGNVQSASSEIEMLPSCSHDFAVPHDRVQAERDEQP